MRSILCYHSFAMNILVFFIGMLCISNTHAFHQDLYVTNTTNFDFGVSDILSCNLMPLKVFAGPYKNVDHSKLFRNLMDIAEIDWHDIFNTSAVFNTMSFHRKMMHKFMVSNFMKHEILKEVAGQPLTIHKRQGFSFSKKEVTNDIPEKQSKNNTMQLLLEEQMRPRSPSAIQKLLYDDGSTQYAAWLQNMATLNDIHRQLGKFQQFGRDYVTNEKQFAIMEDLKNNNDETEFDEGDVTGYALKSNGNLNESPTYFINRIPMPTKTSKAMWLSTTTDTALKPIYRPITNKKGYEGGYNDYGSHPPADSHTPVEITKHAKEIGLKDITDIALTTLAFLSFGMFTLQVLMCITLGKDDSSNTMLLPMDVNETNEIPADPIEEIRRRKRSAILKNRKLQSMNFVSKKILNSIDKFLLFSKDNIYFKDLYWIICKNNKYAKSQGIGKQLWIPIWSLGISWLTSRIINGNERPDNYVPVLNSIKAIIIGLSNYHKCSYE